MIGQGEMLSDIPLFVAAVEAGGFAPAAVRLNLSRSAVGKAVARLEARLGARLLHRTTRTIVLTEDGQIFFEHCRRGLGELEAGRTLLDAGRREVSGRLRVSMPVLFGRQCVAPVLMRLARAHPRLELDLNFSDRLVDLLEDGFDLVLRNGPLQPWPGLMARRVAHQHMRVCAAPSYLDAMGAPKALAHLERHQAILYGRAERVLGWRFPGEAGPATEITPPSRLRFDDLGVIRDAAVAGHGLAWLPTWLIRPELLAGRLVTVLGDLPSHVFDTHALWPQTAHLPLRVRLALDALAAELPEVTSLARLCGDAPEPGRRADGAAAPEVRS